MALTRPYPPYEAIGVKVDGGYRQLNTALLQIENEFYGAIRPKRRIRSGERPLTALRRQGGGIRGSPLPGPEPVSARRHRRTADPFHGYLPAHLPPCRESRGQPGGIGGERGDSARGGGKGDASPGLRLGGELRDNRAEARSSASARRWPGCSTCAHESDLYADALEQQRARARNSSLTPSARILETMASQKTPFLPIRAQPVHRAQGILRRTSADPA